MRVDKHTGIWTLKEAGRKRKFDYTLIGAIGAYFSTPLRAADLGCNTGRYSRVLKAFNWPLVDGYEGTSNIEKIADFEPIFTVDLSKPVHIETKYDFVMCLEVGEHIPKKYEQIFIDNVCNFCSKDLVLSWATPGQGGTGHFNEQPHDYIISEFAKRTFMYNDKLSSKLRWYASVKWFKNNIMVFRKYK